MSGLTSIEQLTPDHERVLAQAHELRDWLIESELDSIAVMAGEVTLRVTRTEAKVSHRTLGLVDVFLEADVASPPSEHSIHEDAADGSHEEADRG